MNTFNAKSGLKDDRFLRKKAREDLICFFEKANELNENKLKRVTKLINRTSMLMQEVLNGKYAYLSPFCEVYLIKLKLFLYRSNKTIFTSSEIRKACQNLDKKTQFYYHKELLDHGHLRTFKRFHYSQKVYFELLNK